jgi:hypothetical protein
MCKQQVIRGAEEAHALKAINKANEGHIRDKQALASYERHGRYNNSD